MTNLRYQLESFISFLFIPFLLILTLNATVTYSQVSKQIVNTGGGGYWLPPSSMEPAAADRGKGKTIQRNITYFQTMFNTDMVAAGFGGIRNVGTGSITLTGVTGPVTKAYLYWHGPTRSSDSTVNRTVNFNGTDVTGVNIGFSSDNCWGYTNSQAYRADVTSLVPSNGAYTLANFIKGGGSTANVNGVSLVVFFNDGNSSNNRDFVIFEGNDSNIPNSYDAPGWNVTLSGINYSSGSASIQMHVGDGQIFPDDALILNGTTLVPTGPIFEGNSVPNGSSAGSTNGGLWDIKNFDITSRLVPGPNTLTLTTGVYSDCLALALAIIDLPAGAAPRVGSSISGMKFNDLNGNGTRDQGEPGLFGWTIKLVGDSSATTTTDSSGGYRFSGLKRGNYEVSEVQQLGWVQTYPAAPGKYTIALDSGQVDTDRNFGNFRPASITGRKFNDFNNNGADDGEPGLFGWTISLEGPVNRTTTTDELGNYRFANLPAGEYTVREMQQSLWVQTFPPFFAYSLDLDPGENVTGINFGNRFSTSSGRGSISGTVFDDRNGNGRRDSGEPPLSGWRVEVSGRGVRKATLTDPDGNYRFTGLSANTYTVQQFLPSGWAQTLPAGGQPYTIPLTSGGSRSGVDFGNHFTPPRTASIRGTAFDDKNGNARQDPEEVGIPGRQIELAGPVSATALTDEKGGYAFLELPEGTYTVRQALPSGAVQTVPDNGDPYSISMTEGADRMGVDFGSRVATAVEDFSETPDGYKLYQNYPNPFNPMTRLTFYLPNDSYITLKVYNVLGIEVAALMEGRFSAGTHSVVWDAQDVPSGIYVYRLTAGNFVAVRKMVLMK